MTVDDFRQSLSADKPPAELKLALAGLWWDAKGDWKRAHESAQQDEGPDGPWVHAYLHRKEGDQGNATYWYGRAGKLVCRQPLDAEGLRSSEACWDERVSTPFSNSIGPSTERSGRLTRSSAKLIRRCYQSHGAAGHRIG